jgi:hypothetical protein
VGVNVSDKAVQILVGFCIPRQNVFFFGYSKGVFFSLAKCGTYEAARKFTLYTLLAYTKVRCNKTMQDVPKGWQGKINQSIKGNIGRATYLS